MCQSHHIVEGKITVDPAHPAIKHSVHVHTTPHESHIGTFLGGNYKNQKQTNIYNLQLYNQFPVAMQAFKKKIKTTITQTTKVIKTAMTGSRTSSKLA